MLPPNLPKVGIWIVTNNRGYLPTKGKEMRSITCPLYLECGFAYEDCDCELRIYCTKPDCFSCGYEVKDVIAYAKYAGGAKGGIQAMFNPDNHYAPEDSEHPGSYARVQNDKRNGVWMCTFAKDKQAIWDRHMAEEYADRKIKRTVTFNEKPEYAKVF